MAAGPGVPLAIPATVKMTGPYCVMMTVRLESLAVDDPLELTLAGAGAEGERTAEQGGSDVRGGRDGARGVHGIAVAVRLVSRQRQVVMADLGGAGVRAAGAAGEAPAGGAQVVRLVRVEVVTGADGDVLRATQAFVPVKTGGALVGRPHAECL